MAKQIKRAKLNENLTLVAASVRATDRIFRTSSIRERAMKRVVDIAERLPSRDAVRHSAYPLSWALETGRASTEFETALVALKPTEFVQIARDVAAAGGNVYDTWDAWKNAVMVSR